MKKLNATFVLVLFIITQCVFAQSRTDRETYVFEKKSPKLTKAKGWKQNETSGKWIKNDNLIDDKPNTYGDISLSFESQNFKSLQICALNYKGKDLYVLLVEKLNGKYRYPNIHQDWEMFKETQFFVLDRKGYEFLKTHINGKWNQEITMVSEVYGEMDTYIDASNYNETNLIAAIVKMLDEGTGYYKGKMTLNSQNVDGKDVVRFLVPDKSDFDFDKIREEYFEVDLSEFQKLFI